MKKLFFLSVLFLTAAAFTSLQAQSCQPSPQCQAACAAKKSAAVNQTSTAEAKTVALTAAPAPSTGNTAMPLKSCQAGGTVQQVNFLNPAATTAALDKKCNPADCKPTADCNPANCKPADCNPANSKVKKADSSL